MRFANLNPVNLVFSILEAYPPSDPSYNREKHYTLEQIADIISHGAHMVALGDGVEAPPYGHRYDEASSLFVPDATWLAERAGRYTERALQATTELEAAQKKLARLSALDPTTVHPLELDEAALTVAALTEEVSRATAQAAETESAKKAAELGLMASVSPFEAVKVVDS
jgi:hypothetical protein